MARAQRRRFFPGPSFVSNFRFLPPPSLTVLSDGLALGLLLESCFASASRSRFVSCDRVYLAKYPIIRPHVHRSVRMALYRCTGPSLVPTSGAIHGSVPHQPSTIVSSLSTNSARSKSIMNSWGGLRVGSTTTFPGFRSR